MGSIASKENRSIRGDTSGASPDRGHAKPINLLQGEYTPRTSFQVDWARWRLVSPSSSLEQAIVQPYSCCRHQPASNKRRSAWR